MTRSSLHRCLQRHGISRLPDIEGDLPAKKKFKVYPIGFFHIRCPAMVCPQTMRGDIAEVRSSEGKLYLFVAIDRTSKFAVVRLYDEATRRTSVQFLEEVLIVVPYKLHTILTEPLLVRHWFKPNGGGIQFGPSSPATATRSVRGKAAST